MSNQSNNPKQIFIPLKEFVEEQLVQSGLSKISNEIEVHVEGCLDNTAPDENGKCPYCGKSYITEDCDTQPSSKVTEFVRGLESSDS